MSDTTQQEEALMGCQGGRLILMACCRVDNSLPPLLSVLIEYLSWRDLGTLEIAVVGDTILRGMLKEALSHHMFHYQTRDEEGSLKFMTLSELKWRITRGIKVLM